MYSLREKDRLLYEAHVDESLWWRPHESYSKARKDTTDRGFLALPGSTM